MTRRVGETAGSRWWCVAPAVAMCAAQLPDGDEGSAASSAAVDDVRTRIFLSRVRSPPDPPGPRVQMKHCLVLALALGGAALVPAVAIASAIAAATTAMAIGGCAVLRRACGGVHQGDAPPPGTRGKEGEGETGIDRHLPIDLTATPNAGTRQGQAR